MVSGSDQRIVLVGPAITKELPGFANFRDEVEIEIRRQDFVLVARGLGDDLAPRVAEIARPVKFADVPGGFRADAIDGGDVIAVGDGVRGLLQFPEMLAEAGHGRRGVEYDLGAVESKGARAFGEVADVDRLDYLNGVTSTSK